MARIAVIPGDGIGPDVIAEGIKVLETVARITRARLDLVHFDLGAERYLRTGETLPQPVFEDLRDNYDAIYLGALGDPRVPDMKHAADILLGLRFRLDLYVNMRPVKLLDLATDQVENMGTRAAARATDLDHLLDLGEVESEAARPSDEAKRGDDLRPIDAVSRRGAARARKDSGRLVQAQRLPAHATLGRELSNQQPGLLLHGRSLNPAPRDKVKHILFFARLRYGLDR